MNGGVGGGRGGGVPTLSYVSDEYDRAGVRCGTTLHTVGGFHGNFVDAALRAPQWVMRPLSAVVPAAGPSDPFELHAAIAATGAAFVASGRPSSALGSSRLLELRGGLSSSSSSSSSSSPAAMVRSWRLSRLGRFASSFDASRYHAQVLLARRTFPAPRGR